MSLETFGLTPAHPGRPAMLAINLQSLSLGELRHQRDRQSRARWDKANSQYRKAQRATPENKARAVARSRRARLANPERNMLAQVQSRAKARGIPFNLDLSDLAIPPICPVLGIPIAFSRGLRHGAYRGSPSVDRIIPALGYVKGNVRVISNRANTLRSDATVSELRAVLRYAEELAGAPVEANP